MRIGCLKYSSPFFRLRETRLKASGGRPYDPQSRLIIRDPKTSALLWAFTEHVPWAILQGNRDKNFDRTLDRIMSDVKGLTIQSPAAPDRADKP
jgi:hypothetical protein